MIGEVLREIEALGSKMVQERRARDERLSSMTSMILQLAGLNFDVRAQVTGNMDDLDGIASGLNMLREELQSSTLSRAYLNNVFGSMSDAVVVTNADGTIRTANQAVTKLLGFEEKELLGKPVSMLFSDLLGHEEIGELRGHDVDCPSRSGERITVSVSASPLRAGEKVDGFVCVLRDVTERKRADEERRQLEEAIATKNDLIRTMSTPIMPISDDIVVMPLVGTVDRERADQVIDSLLRGIAETTPRVAILDITAVPFVDEEVANTLVRAANAARMLGVSVVLTGLRAEVAKTLVDMGLDLPGVKTCSTLKSGIALSMSQRARKTVDSRRKS